MKRVVEPEILDELPAADPRAQASRRDLRRLNWWMGHAAIFAREWQRALRTPPRRLVELGAGDGTLMLRLARRFARRWPGVEVTLVDRQPVVSSSTLEAFAALGWRAEPVAADVFDWLAQPVAARVDLMNANLFLHHFEPARLAGLLLAAAQRTNCFVACETRRRETAPLAGRLCRLTGCTAVTCHDAVISVRAGFAGTELSELWPRAGGWSLRERAAGLFSHAFTAQPDPE